MPPSQKKSKKEAEAEVVPEVEKKSLPAVGSVVRGYVKSASTRGLFVALSRSVDAYARLCNLAETFVTEPAASFPAGMLVTARVMSVDGRGRVEVKLTTSHACTLSVLSLSLTVSPTLSLCLSHSLSHTLSHSLTRSLAVSLSLTGDAQDGAARGCGGGRCTSSDPRRSHRCADRGADGVGRRAQAGELRHLHPAGRSRCAPLAMRIGTFRASGGRAVPRRPPASTLQYSKASSGTDDNLLKSNSDEQ